jgi:hypothetical protein
VKFDIDNYRGAYVMHCKTEEEAKDFCEYLNSIGRTWCDGGSYKKSYCYYEHGNKTAYNFNGGSYSNVEKYLKWGYKILEWSDFMEFTKADLKTGDVVKYRSGDVEIVNRELEMLISKTGWDDLDSIQDDLTSRINPRYDIIAVRRPEIKSDCQFGAFDNEWGTLVYERKEVEEMTLAQVCKLLGKEIKIVKG